MKLYIPDFNFYYAITPKGIMTDVDNVIANEDKNMYLALLDILNMDFENAPYDVSKNNFLGQKIEHIIKANKVFKIQTTEPLVFQKNLELPKANWGWIQYPENNDLQ